MSQTFNKLVGLGPTTTTAYQDSPFPTAQAAMTYSKMLDNMIADYKQKLQELETVRAMLDAYPEFERIIGTLQKFEIWR